jgi:hypothetical protein
LEKSTSYEAPHYAVSSNLLSLHPDILHYTGILRNEVTHPVTHGATWNIWLECAHGVKIFASSLEILL